MSKGAPSSSWRAPILANFTPELARVSRLTVVSDPDQLFAEQGVLDSIRRQGFELISFDDHVAFRYAFESRYRQVWDRGEETKLVVVVRAGEADVNGLPFDLLEQARQDSRLLSFSIGDLFPSLDPRVVASLDRADLDALYQAQASNRREILGENDTRDFILEHVFDVSAQHIKTVPDLISVLLQRHYRGRAFPPALDDRFIYLLEQTRLWNDWPLHEIVSDRPSFLAFIQERWPIFVTRKVSGPSQVAESDKPYGLRFGGPDDLPFDHEKIRVYMDNLFLEGHLVPTNAVPKSAVEDPWMAVGVVGDADQDAEERFRRLVDQIEGDLPTENADHTKWLDVASRWAEATVLRWRLSSSATKKIAASFSDLHDRLEGRFAEWMLEHYASLSSLGFVPVPVMVHHVPHFLARDFVPSGRDGATQKRAVIVVDGLALDQWVLLRDDLKASGGMSVDQGAVFAWVPTLTSVSRQAIFSGEFPLFFPETIGSTHKEEHHWRRFWEDRGARRDEVAYVCQKKQEDEDRFLQRVHEAAEHPKCRVMGVVVGTIDQNMHGNPMGTGGMQASVRHWVEMGYFRKLVSLLHENGFEVCMTADHGNVEALGMGKPNVGDIADERGQRAHVFRDDLTRAKVHAEYDDTIIWPQVGLPDDYRALLAGKRTAFMHKGQRAVTHGGISIEEVIVPFVRIQEIQ